MKTKMLLKWNYRYQVYDSYEIPEDWNVKTFSNDMDEIVNCCQCGKAIKFGDGYTSKEVHTKAGMGYAVCEDCYSQEWERDKESR